MARSSAKARLWRPARFFPSARGWRPAACSWGILGSFGEGSIVAAGTLVPEGTVVPPGSLFMGHPGKFRRVLTPEDQASIEAYATRYVEYSETYKAEAGKA